MTDQPTVPLPIVGALRWAASQNGSHPAWWWPWLHLVPADAPVVLLPNGIAVRFALCGLATIVAPVPERDTRERCAVCKHRRPQWARVLRDTTATDYTTLVGQAIGDDR